MALIVGRLILLCLLPELSSPQSMGFPPLRILDRNEETLTTEKFACDGETFSCQGRCGDDKHMPCSCDDICQMYQDCCQDYQSVCDSPMLPYNNTESPNNICLETSSTPERLINCCPTEYANTTIVEKCEQAEDGSAAILDAIPVADPETGLNYRNLYCAICNGVEKIVGWEAKLMCPSTDPVKLGLGDLLTKIKTGRCPFKPNKPQSVPGRPCIIHAIQDCPINTTASVRQQCNAYTSYVRPVLRALSTYANIQCYLCNNKGVMPELCMETTVDKKAEVTRLQSDYETSALVWNKEKRTWGLSLVSLSEQAVTSELFLCEIGDILYSNCPPPAFAKRTWIQMIPVTTRIVIQVIKIGNEPLNLDALSLANFDLEAMLDESFGNMSWKMVGSFVNKVDNKNGFPHVLKLSFLYVDVFPSLETMMYLKDLVKEGLQGYIQNHYPRNKVSLLIDIEKYHSTQFGLHQTLEVLQNESVARNLHENSNFLAMSDRNETERSSVSATAASSLMFIILVIISMTCMSF